MRRFFPSSDFIILQLRARNFEKGILRMRFTSRALFIDSERESPDFMMASAPWFFSTFRHAVKNIAIKRILLGCFDDEFFEICKHKKRDLHRAKLEVKKESIDFINIIACGTSYYSGLVGKYLIEKFTDIPVVVELSSEFRYFGTKKENSREIMG
jgi:hypothetical protein